MRAGTLNVECFMVGVNAPNIVSARAKPIAMGAARSRDVVAHLGMMAGIGGVDDSVGAERQRSPGGGAVAVAARL